jgi:molybdenum cofactor cytidylyltransferase
MSTIRSIILAAGESKRMGFPKMLLQFNGKTMIEKVIENVADSDSDSILVVLGSDSDELIGVVSEYDVKYCYNDNYRKGMLSSVQCGIKNLPLDTGAFLVFQGDQPFISPEVINSVIGAYRSSGKGIIIPVCNEKRGHPLLLDIKYREQIDHLDPDEGLRAITRIHSDDIHEVETDETGILRDFDTYDDYIRELNQTK